MTHQPWPINRTLAHISNTSVANSDSCSADYWLEKLTGACEQAHIDTAYLEIINKGLNVSVSYSHSAVPDNCSAKRHPASCVAKLFTSTLVALLVMQGKLEFENKVTELLPALSSSDHASNVLHGITVSQLLSHTHGLGCVDLDVAPVRADGFIDCEKVMSLLQKNGRIFAPGKFYSYGMAGYMLLGGIIERITRETYGDVLYKKILLPVAASATPLSLDSNPASAGLPICPSSGRGLNIAPGELPGFASCFLTPDANVLNLPAGLLAEIFSTRKLMPGWSPTISGSCYGWKNFANNWYGHNGIDSEHLMYVRVNRATGTAICLSARSDKRKSAALPSLLLQHAFPELIYSSAKQPSILTDAPADSFGAIIGTYGNCLSNFSIGLKNSRLVVEISSLNESKEAILHQCYLYPAEDNISFLAKPWQNITFLQLVTDGNSARYLWDHTQLWPELTG